MGHKAGLGNVQHPLVANDAVDKFGRNEQIDAGVMADLWDGGNTGDVSLIWVAPTEARIHALVSTSINDTETTGSGARNVRISGLTSWTANEVNETVSLNGTTPVNTVNSYVIIHRMEVLDHGTTNINTGTITATAATDATITAQITPTLGQTHMLIYGIPDGKTLLMSSYWSAMNKASGGGSTGFVDLCMFYNDNPAVEITQFKMKLINGLSLTGTSSVPIPFPHGKRFEGPGILKLQSFSATNGMDVSAGWNATLIDS